MEREEHNSDRNKIPNMLSESTRRVQKLVAQAYAPYASGEGLVSPTPEIIRAGIAGGLPFDSLTTDVVVGCLPASHVCYGNCFAAQAAFTNGINFGVRIENILDKAIFQSDLNSLSRQQRYLRNGWNSDPSWSWSCALAIAELIRDSGRHTIFVTKCFGLLSHEMMNRLASLHVEIRISVSAFDTDAQLTHRMKTVEAYRLKGGVAIPIVVSTVFQDPVLKDKQDRIVASIVESDLPGGENSLRFNPNSPVTALLNKSASRPIAQSSDWWCGRLYPKSLPIPTVTTLPPEYEGLQSRNLSGNDPIFLKSLFYDPVPTRDEVLSSHPLTKPTQAGVPNEASKKQGRKEGLN